MPHPPIEWRIGDHAHIRLRRNYAQVQFPCTVEAFNEDKTRVRISLSDGTRLWRTPQALSRIRPLTPLQRFFAMHDQGSNRPVPCRITVHQGTHCLVEWSDGHADKHPLDKLALYGVRYPFFPTEPKTQ